MKKLIKVCVIIFTTSIMAFRIIIDAGHGGRFNGCKSSSGNLLEKDITLSLAKKLAEQLQIAGVKTILSRHQDRDYYVGNIVSEPPLSDQITDELTTRIAHIKKLRPDVVISLHFNSGTPATRGFELYVPYQTNFPQQCYQLASSIHHALTQNMENNWQGTLGNLNAYDRGIRAARFLLLRGIPCPIVLVEVDYLTNGDVEKKLIKNDDFITAVAKAMVSGIKTYIGDENY